MPSPQVGGDGVERAKCGLVGRFGGAHVEPDFLLNDVALKYNIIHVITLTKHCNSMHGVIQIPPPPKKKGYIPRCLPEGDVVVLSFHLLNSCCRSLNVM